MEIESPPSPSPSHPPPPLPEQQPQQHGSQSPVSKRRKVEHRVVITVRVDDDGSRKHKADGPPSDLWSWRKYGQKPIKGSPYPRGYYRCSTSKGCSAKKQVERCRTDASLLIITYTSTHDHAGPDLHQITSSQAAPSAAAMEYKSFDNVETEGEEVALTPVPAHNNNHCAGASDGANQSTCCASPAGGGVPDNCNTDVPSDQDSKDGGHADAGPERQQVATCSVGKDQDKVLGGCHTEESPENPPISSHDPAGQHLDQISCSAATPAQDELLVSCNDGVVVPTPSSTHVSVGCEAETKVPENLNPEEAQTTASPPTREDEEGHPNREEQPRPPSPPKHSPESTNLASDTATDKDDNHTLQSGDVPFDEGSVGLPSTQTGLPSEEFDFYDELDELPTISPWTSVLMGCSFFDERILLPS